MYVITTLRLQEWVSKCKGETYEEYLRSNIPNIAILKFELCNKPRSFVIRKVRKYTVYMPLPCIYRYRKSPFYRLLYYTVLCDTTEMMSHNLWSHVAQTLKCTVSLAVPTSYHMWWKNLLPLVFF